MMCNAQGKQVLTPAYAKEACDNYHAMIKSDKEVGKYTGYAGLGNGERGLIQKGTKWNFLATPLAFDVIMYAGPGTIFLTGQSPPPPGCS